MKYRTLNKIIARLLGYFWVKYPLCKQYFGGHEWNSDHCTPTTTKGLSEGICPDCGNNV